MRQRLYYALFFLLALLFSLASSLPAGHLLAWSGPLPGGVSLHGVEGSVWEGRAQQLVVRGQSLGSLRWRLSPWALLLAEARLGFEINRDGEYLFGALRWGDVDDWRLSGVEGELELSRLWPALKGQSPQLAALPVAVDGRLRFFFDELALDGEGPRAHGRLNWLGAGAGMPQPLPLGDLSLQLEGREGRFADAGGPMRLEGGLELNGEGGYVLDLKLAARDSAEPMLKQGLAFLGAPDAEGRYRFRMEGALIQP